MERQLSAIRAHGWQRQQPERAAGTHRAGN